MPGYHHGRAQLYWWPNSVLQRDTQPNKQYMKGKPHPWGLKIWSRWSASGILYDFALYECGTSKKIFTCHGRWCCAQALWNSPIRPQLQSICNLFSSAPLVLNLLQWKIYFVGTLQGNCFARWQLKDRGRGSVDTRVEKEESMVIVVWQQICYPDLILWCSWASR